MDETPSCSIQSGLVDVYVEKEYLPPHREEDPACLEKHFISLIPWG